MSLHSHYDIAIIGSGAGDGTVADVVSRETDPDTEILVLEGGPLWRHDRFKEMGRDMGRLFFHRGAKPSKNLTANLAAASAVGGSTVVYTGVSFRPPDRVIEHWRIQFGLDFLTDDYVDGTLDAIENDLNAHTLSRD